MSKTDLDAAPDAATPSGSVISPYGGLASHVQRAGPGERAALSRIDAATASARAVRIALVSEIAGAVIDWRTPDGAASAATSGLALGVGYSAAAVGPLVMGVLIDVTAGYSAAVAVLLAAGALQGAAIWRIGDRPR